MSHEQAPRPSPYYIRVLERIGYVRSSSRTECKVVNMARKLFTSRVRLIGIPARCDWDDLLIDGQSAELPSTDMQHRAKDHLRALPIAGNRKKWRLYTDGITFRVCEEVNGVWILRISLSLIWEFVKTWEETTAWNQIKPCPHFRGVVQVGRQSIEGQ